MQEESFFAERIGEQRKALACQSWALDVLCLIVTMSLCSQSITIRNTLPARCPVTHGAAWTYAGWELEGTEPAEMISLLQPIAWTFL